MLLKSPREWVQVGDAPAVAAAWKEAHSARQHTQHVVEVRGMLEAWQHSVCLVWDFAPESLIEDPPGSDALGWPDQNRRVEEVERSSLLGDACC